MKKRAISLLLTLCMVLGLLPTAAFAVSPIAPAAESADTQVTGEITVPTEEGELQSVQTYATASQSPTWEIRNAAHDKRTVIYGNGFPLKLEGYTPKGSSITYTRISYGTQNTTDFDSCTTDMNLDGLGVTACENAGKRYYNLSEVTIYGGTGTLDEIKEAGKPGKPKIDVGGSIYMIGGEVASLVGGSRVNGSKNTEIRMTGGTVTGNIYGGNMGYLYDMGDFTDRYFTKERYEEKILYEFRANVTGSMNITISGGTVGGSVYAGGYNYACTGTGTVKVLSSADVDGAKVVVGPELLANSPLYYQDKFGHSQNDTSRSLKFFVDRVGFDTTTREEDTHATNQVKHECSNALYRTTDGYTVHGTVSADDIAEKKAVIIAKGTNLKFDANAQLNANGLTIVNHGIVNMLRGGAISGGSFRSDGKVLPPVTVDNIVNIPEQPYLSKGAKPTITLTGAKVVIDGKTFEMAAENNFKTTYKYNDNLGIYYFADAIITSIDDPTFSLTKQFYIVQGYSTIGDVKFLRADGTQVSTISDSFYVSFNVLSIDDDVVADKTPDLNNLTKTGTYPLGESSLTIRDRKTQKVIFTTKTVYEDKNTPDYYVFKVSGTDTTTLSALKVAAGANDVTISVGEINYFHPAEKTVQKDGFPLCYYMPEKDSWALTSYGYPMVISAGTKDASKLVFSNEDGTCVYADANGNTELTINPKTAIGSATTKYIPESSYVTVKSGKISLVTGGVADVSHIYGNAVLQNAHLTIEGGTIGNAFGAAVSLISQLNGSPVTQNAHVTMTGGHVTNLYGGGKHNAVTTGNTYVLVTGGTADHVYGGGDRKNTVYGDRNGVVLVDGAAEADSFDNLLYRVGNQYVVKGSLTLWEDLTIPAGITLIVPQGASLTIPNGVGFTVENGGFIGLGAHIVVQPGASVALAGSIAVLESNVVAYTGSPVTAKTVVAIGDCTFTEGADYTVTYRDNTNEGTATAVLTGKAGGRLTGSVELPFTISASMGTVTVDASYARSYINNSKPIPAPTDAQITRNSKGAVSISWYAGSLTAAQIAISTPLSGAPSAVGEYTLVCKVAADGTYSEATALTKITVSYAEAEAVATISGTMKRPESGWYTSDVILTAPAGYTISSDGNAAAEAWAGTVTIATDMNGDYTYYLKNSSGLVGTAQKILVHRDTVCDVNSFVYASSDAMDATLVSSDGINLSISTQLKVTNMGNEESFDVYTIIAPWNTEPTEADILLGTHQHVTALGSHPVTISGKYYGIKSLRASVLLIDAAGNSRIPNSAEIDKYLSKKPVGIDFSSDDLTVTVDGEEPIYDGFSHSLKFSVRYKGVLLPEIAYELTHTNGPIEPGSYPVTAKPKGDTYSTNEKAGTFTIHPITLTEDSLIWNNFALNQQYTGEAQTPANYLTTQPVRYEVKETTEFSVAYRNNTEPGTAEVIVTGKKHYTGSAIKRFNIVKKNTSYETISDGEAKIAYTGKPISIDISRIAANPQNFTLDEMVATYYASFDDMKANRPMAQGPIDVGTYYVTIGFPGDRYRAAATMDGSVYVTLTVYAKNNTNFTLPDLMVYERAADLPNPTTKERNIQGLLDTYKLGLRYDTSNSVAASVVKFNAEAESSLDLVKSSSNKAAMSETFKNVKSGNRFKARLGTNVSGGGYDSVWFHYIVKVVTEIPKTDFSDRVSLTTTTKAYTGEAVDFSGVTVTNPPEGYDENKWEYSYGSATIASDKNDRPKEIGEYLVSAHYTDVERGLTASIITPVKVEVPAAIDAKSASAPYGGSVTLTAQLHKQSTPWQAVTGGAESADRIYFYHNGILLGNPLVSYSDGANQVNGVASITLAIDSKRLLASGANTVTAVFAGGAKLSACQQDFTVTVERISLSNDMVSPVGSYIYHPAGLTPTLNVTGNLGIQPSDWKIESCTYGTGQDIGKATVTIVPTEGSYYSGTASATFAVSPKAVSAAVPKGVAIAPAADVAYTGSVVKPVLSITDSYAGGVKTLVEGTDYTISTTAVEIGAATATVTFKGNYSGSMTAGFAIKAPSELGTLTVKNGAIDTSVFAFGDTITVSFTPKQKVAAFGLTAPSVNQAALYLGDTQLTAPVVANKDGCFTLSYDTAGKGIPMGSRTLTIKYGGSEALSASTKEFGITLTAKDIRPTIAAIAPVTYNGKAHTPAITVTYNGQPITAADYDVTYSDNINAGTATALVTLKGNYTGTRSQSFTINALTITPTVTVSTEGTTYTGRQITPAVTVKNGNTTLIQGQEYTVAYGKNIDVGNGTVTVTLKGNYTGSKTETFAITKSGSTVTPEASTKATYGDTITLTATVGIQEVAPLAALNQVEFFCGGTSLGSADVIAGVATLAYNTADKKLKIGDNIITATFGGNDNLLLNDSKTNTITVNLKAKAVTATVSGTITKVYDTTATTTVNLIVADGDKVSTGDVITVTAAAAYSDANAGTGKAITFSGVQKSGDHSSYYTVSAPSSATGEITAKTVASPTITLEHTSYTYTGSAIQPVVTSVKDEANTIPTTEYTVTYSANTDVSDTAPTVTIADAANGNYAVSGTKTFTITKSESTTTPDTNPTEARTYTYGDQITLTATVGTQEVAPLAALNQVEFFCGGTSLGSADVSNNIATLAYNTTDKKLQIGANTVTAVYGGSVNLNGSESGEITVTLNAKPLTGGMIGTIAEQAYTGSAITPTGLTVTDGSQLTEGTDYTIQSYASNTNAGTGSVTIHGAGWYTGTAAKSFTINPKDTGTATAAKTVRYNDTAEQTADIAAAVASLKAGTEELTYTLGSISDTHTLLAEGTAVDSSTGSLTFTLKSGLTDANKAQTASIPVTVTGLTNYTTVTATVTITITDKISVTVDMSGITLTDKVYDGAAITYAGAATGTYGEENTAYEGGFTDEWYKDATKLGAAPTNVGSYTLKVIVSDPAYAGEGIMPVQITKASQEAPAGLTAVRPTTDADADGKITGLDSSKSYEYKLSGDANYIPVAASSTEIPNLVPGTYLVRVAGDDNHNPSGDTAVTVKAYAPTVTFNSVTANGASGTTTTTQLTITLGSDTVLTADNITLTGAAKGVLTGSGSIYTLAISGSFANGATVTVTLDGDTAVFMPASHEVTVYQYVPSGGSGSGSGGGAVNSKPTVSFNQGGTATATNSGNVTITPDTGYQIGKITVNGKEVTIPENGKLTGLTRKDNVEITFEKIPQETTPVSERFSDIPADAWYAESVQFVVDNGLFSGTSKTAFSPKATTTRGMLWTVLYRHAGATTKGEGKTWYADAHAWAKEIGISDGKNPEGEISREQLATILYRYAKGKSTTADMSKFSDTNEISGFAAEAMNWAVEQGILQGANGKLNPKASASRAEVAAMVTRFVKNMAN